jgi:lipoprotein-releasing system permease protein
MKTEFLIARRLKLGDNTRRKASPSIVVALAGIVLAIVIMILSIVIVMGFKSEITHKIFALNPHLKVTNAALGLDDNIATVNGPEVFKAILADSIVSPRISSISLMAEKPAILKTDNDFQAIVYQAVDDGFDWSYLKSCLVEGRTPSYTGTANVNEIVMSRIVADKLQLHVGDRVFTYFIDNKVKARRSVIVGIYSSDFDNYDKIFIVGNIAALQSVNGWPSNIGNYVGVNLTTTDHLADDSYHLYGTLAAATYDRGYSTLHRVTEIRQTNQAYFTWLNMLDMNVVIIIVLMVIVSAFTLISAMLMIVLERIRTIGLLKALGASNAYVRRIFIYLTLKLIVRAIIIGNVVGIGLALIQQHLHVVRLNPDAYNMPYVPIQISIPALLLLNLGIIVVAYLTLLAPSHIISTIKPASTMKFE